MAVPRQRIARAMLVVFALLVAQNVWTIFRNQRTLPDYERFESKPRDLEKLARVHYRWPVSQWIAIFYLLEHRIAGKRVTVPPLLENARWDLEKVARVQVEVADDPLKIKREQARAIRGKARDIRPFQIGTRRRPWVVDFYLLHDPEASHYYLVRWESELFLVPEAEYERIKEIPSKGGR